MTAPPGLLVSVRSVAEARAALAGGADLIDVKEPNRGPLGAADGEVIRAIAEAIEGCLPVSVALGEWAGVSPAPLPAGVTYAKWGLSGWNGPVRAAVRQMRECTTAVRPVLVAYADWRRAGSPDTQVLADLACEMRFAAFLIDTAVKDGSGLPDWLSLAQLVRIRRRLALARVPLALAGSLDVPAIRMLAPLAPDWFAVRGAVCVGGRTGQVCPERVKSMADFIRSTRRSGRAS